MKPNYSPNVVNQTVDYGGSRWKGNPGGDWVNDGPTGGGSTAAPTPAGAPAGANADALNARFATDKNDVTSFLTKYQGAVPGIINDTSAKYSIPGQMEGVNALNTRVKTLQGNLDNSGGGGYSNASQVDSAINSRYLPQYSTALQNLNTSAVLAQTEEGQLTKPYEAEGQLLNDRLAREMTGYTAEQQRELDGYVARLRAGTDLTMNERDNANKLALAQKSYQATIDAQKLQNQNVTLSGGSTYYNPATGVAYNPFAKVGK